MSDTVKMNVKGLDQLLKALKAKPPIARVGILGSQNAVHTTDGSSSAEGLTNAEIGAIHEFGLGNNPQRSFLRIPISENLQKSMKASGAFDKEVLAGVIASGTVIPWVKKVAIIAEAIVAQAFDTGGFGAWPASNMAGKKNHQTLVETQQLRNSITSEVEG